jgi:hypothetical protein
MKEPAGYLCEKCLDEREGIEFGKAIRGTGILPLTPREAIAAMLDGKVLRTKNGNRVKWSETENTFVSADTNQPFTCFACFYVQKTRPMTRYEIMAWAQSPESKGWLVNIRLKGYKELEDDWQFPCHYKYDNYEHTADDIYEYVRAPLLPDCSGVDETKMTMFEVEEKNEKEND